MNLGTIIQALRRLHKLTQQELADKLQVERPYLSALENNHCDPSLKLLKKLGDIFNVPPAFLLIGEGNNKELLHEVQDILWKVVITQAKRKINL